MKVLALVTDAYGGYGGIAQYNRDLLNASAANPDVTEVTVLPRLKYHGEDPMPEKIRHDESGLGGRLRYSWALLRIVFSARRFDLVLCCHINLLPLAWLAARRSKASLLLTVFGIDAWQRPASTLSARLINRVDGVIAISRYTRRRFLSWATIAADRVWLLPNAIQIDLYGVGAKNQDLIKKYGLTGKQVILTFGRLAFLERYKGFDEVLDAMPEMLKANPNLVYLIAGDGNDRGRLEAKVAKLGLTGQVCFTGMIKEEEKAEIFRLADAYVMPSRGEGFGFVFLEAMACGLPAIASRVDGSLDAAADGELADLVTPGDQAELIRATFAALQKQKRIPPTLERFSFQQFSQGVGRIMRAAAAKSGV